MSMRKSLLALSASVMAWPVAAAVPVSSSLAARIGPAPILAQAQAPAEDPLSAHAAIEQAKAGLTELDATLTMLDAETAKLADEPRRQAHVALQALRAKRDAYAAEVNALVADAGQATADQIAKARAALRAQWAAFEQSLDSCFNAIGLDLAARKAVIAAQIDAEQRYWTRGLADLETQAATLAADKRAAIEARIAGFQKHVDAAKARLTKLQEAKSQVWSALRQGLGESRHLFGQTYDAVESAIEKGEQ